MLDRDAETNFLLQCLNLLKDNEIDFSSINAQDWNQLGRRIFQHKIAPLVYRNLSKDKRLSQIPDMLSQDMRLEYFQCSLNNTRRYYELSKILKSAEENNIPIIVLKGAVLAGLVYSSYALRPMDDIDLLIKPEDIRETNNMLIQLGWKCKIRDGLLEILNQQGQDIKYVKDDIFLDVHTALKELPISDYWANSQCKGIASLKMRILSYEDILIHLCLHIYRHFQMHILLGNFGITEIIKLYDVVLLLRNFRNEINWDYIVQTSKISNSKVGLYTILNIVNRDLGEYVPDKILEELKTDAIDLSINRLLYSSHKASKIVTFLISNRLTEHFGMMLALHNANPEKHTTFWFVKFVFRSLFPNREYMIKRYEIKQLSLLGFYYTFRLIMSMLMFLKAIPLYIQSYKERIKKQVSEN